jgi:hypothetical protein
MRYIMLLKATEITPPPPPGLLEAIMKLGEEATAAGVLLDNAGLAPSAKGARIRVSGGQLSVTDGPFAEAKEFISYAQYEVRTKEEAIEWSARFMKIHQDLVPGWEGDCEVLKVYGPEDFGAPGQ